MPCRMCLRDLPLVDSHIIPRSFYRIDHSDGQPTKLVSNVPGEHPKRIPIGEYDQIVCEECERLFSPWDQYANELLLTAVENRRDVMNNGQVVAQLIQEYDYHNLKMFFLSLLWRISAATRPMFGSINLGPYQEILRNLILNQNVGEIIDFSTLISQFDANTPVLNPHYERWDGIRYVRVYLANYVAHTKVDRQRPPRGPLSDVSMHPDRPLCIIARDFQGSAEYRMLRNMLDDNPNLFRTRH